MLTCGIKIWEEVQLLTSKEIQVEVQHAKEHRTEKDKKDTTQFEKFAADGDEKAEELTKRSDVG